MALKKTTMSRGIDIMADTTLFRGMVRIDINNSTSFSYSFVLNKALQLPKSPLMNPLVVSSSSPNMCNILKYNNTSFVNSINNSSAYIMVLPSHKPIRPAREFFKLSLSGFRAFSLEFTYNPISLLTERLNFFSIESSVTCDSEIIYSDINTKNSVLEARAIGINVFRECEQKETSAFFVYPQEAFSNFPSEILPITIWDGERNLNSAFDCSQTQNIVLHRSRTRKVISHTNFIDYWFTLSLLDHTTGLFDTSDSELALQSKTSNLFVDKRMELDVVPNFFSPSSIDTELQSFRVDFKSLNYLFGCIDFDFSGCSCFHRDSEDVDLFKCYDFGFSRKSLNLNFSPLGRLTPKSLMCD